LLTLLREVGGVLGAVFGRPPKRGNRPVRAAPGDRRCPARRGAITVIDKESYISDDWRSLGPAAALAPAAAESVTAAA